MSIMRSHEAFFAQYRDVENTLNFARDIHEAQTRLKETQPRLYDRAVHAGVVSLHLRTVGRKIDHLAIELHRRIHAHCAGAGVSRRARRLQEALREYNAATACQDPWEMSQDAAAQALDWAFQCFEAIDAEIRAFEQIDGQQRNSTGPTA